MHSADLDVLEGACQWLAEGRRIVLGTVVRTWGSAPRPVGSMMVMDHSGHVMGSVSGGCIEQDLIERIQCGRLATRGVELLSYGGSAEEARRFGLPCGGELKLVLEPVGTWSQLEALRDAVRQQRLVTRMLDLETGNVVLVPGNRTERMAFDGRTMVTSHGPRARLIVIGAVQIARYVASFAQSLDYQVVVCEPRAEYRDAWDVPGVAVLSDMPDDVLLTLQPDCHTAVVALTHDPKLDDLALLEALKSPAFYVGVLGSKTSHVKRCARLAMFDLTAEEISRLHGPVGIRLGGNTPPEIALAILAEMTMIRNGVSTAPNRNHDACSKGEASRSIG